MSGNHPEVQALGPGGAEERHRQCFLSAAFSTKPLVAVGYSGGISDGVCAIEHLAQIAVETEMVPLRTAVVIHQVAEAFVEAGNRSIR